MYIDEIVDVWSLWFLDNVFCLLIIVLVSFRYVKICCPAVKLSIKNWCALFCLTKMTVSVCLMVLISSMLKLGLEWMRSEGKYIWNSSGN